MLELPSSRKRQRSEPLQLNESSQSISKKQKLSHSGVSVPPAAFWDNLSTIWLTKRALRELDRRNAQSTQSPPRLTHRRTHRPVTRSFLNQLKLSARDGGPDLSDLRNYPEPIHLTMSSSHPSFRGGRKRGSAVTSNTKSTTNTTRTKSTGVYDRDFQQHLVDHGVYPDEYEYPDGSVPAKPNNWTSINQILTQPRASLSPSRFSDEEFRKFKRAAATVPKEKQVSESVIPIIEGKIADIKCRSGGIPFTNFDPLTDGTLKPGNPDIYYGARTEQVNRKVRDELSGRIIPSTQHDLPTAPNFYLAAKGPDGTLAVAERQACYDGALGARCMHSLLSYEQEERVYDNAHTITSIYLGGILKIYTSHLAQSSVPGGRPEYHMTQLGVYGLTHNIDVFRQGAAAYRNAADWAKMQRDDAIRQANDRAKSQATASGADVTFGFASEAEAEEPYAIEPLSEQSRTSLNEDSQTTNDLQESETSTEEVAQDKRVPRKRPSRHPRPSVRRRRKRRNAGESSRTENSHGSAITSVSEISSSSNTAVELTEKWSLINGTFQCHQGQTLINEQDETPADVWVFYDQGWPGQEGKKWRLWITATREILYC